MIKPRLQDQCNCRDCKHQLKRGNILGERLELRLITPPNVPKEFAMMKVSSYVKIPTSKDKPKQSTTRFSALSELKHY